MQDWFVQLLGFIGLGIIFFSFQKAKRSSFLTLLFTGQLFVIAHFTLLGAWSAAVMNAIAATRSLLFKKRVQSNNTLLYLFIVCFWLAGIFTWAGYHSLVLALAFTLETIALWKEDTQNIRYIMLAARPLFFVYNFVVGSVAAMVADGAFLVSLIVGIVRMRKKR
ncbi:MAG: YgjV family protein [Nanoarchaeota archaeon]|nr:YgjV family protein [Nanoarchaeota archaeon]